MLTFLSFILVILGCVNWLLIGLLQYDFVAGLFGYQGSIFSRIIYIIIGIASAFLVFKAFAEKGKLNLINFKFSFKKKRDKKKEEAKAPQENLQPSHNVEASREFQSQEEKHIQSGSDYSEKDALNQPQDEREKPSKNNIFDDLN